MRGHYVLLVAAFALAVTTGCHRGQVRLPVGPGSDRHVWRDPIDLEAYRAPARRLLYTAEPPVGYAEARHRPHQFLSIAVCLNWNVAVRPLPAAFEQLCVLHNDAGVSLSEFTEHDKRLRAILADAGELKSGLDAILAQYDDRLPATSTDAEDVRPAAQDLGTRAKRIIERAAERVAELNPPETQPVPPGADPTAAP